MIASDISTDALRRTRAARYSQREIEGVSPARLARFMHRAGDGWEVDTEIRGRVDVVHHNLAGGPMPAAAGQCQVVFCRNVLIYFNLADSVKFLDRLAEWLPVGGYLFLGYSESLWQVTDRFTLEHLRNAFVYRRPGGKRVPPPVIPAAPETRVASDGGHPTSMAAAPEYGSAPDDDVPSVALLHSEGEAALSAGDHRTAIAAFRKVIYLDPDDFTAGLHLGFALEAAGHFRDAQRAYRACRAALDRSEVAAIEAALEGYSHEQLLELLDRKIRHLAAM